MSNALKLLLTGTQLKLLHMQAEKYVVDLANEEKPELMKSLSGKS